MMIIEAWRCYVLNASGGIQYAVIRVGDPEAAALRFARLGFEPAGALDGAGAGGRRLQFGSAQVQLVGTAASPAARGGLDALGLACGAGSCSPDTPRRGCSGTRLAETVPGVRLLACAHAAAGGAARGPGEGPSAPRTIIGVTLLVEEPAAAARQTAEALGCARLRCGGAAFVRLGPSLLRFVSPARSADLYPNLSRERRGPSVLALHLELNDIGRAWARLAANGVPHCLAADGSLRVQPDYAGGVVLSFEPPGAGIRSLQLCAHPGGAFPLK